jgi:hypothetical protein
LPDEVESPALATTRGAESAPSAVTPGELFALLLVASTVFLVAKNASAAV